MSLKRRGSMMAAVNHELLAPPSRVRSMVPRVDENFIIEGTAGSRKSTATLTTAKSAAAATSARQIGFDRSERASQSSASVSRNFSVVRRSTPPHAASVVPSRQEGGSENFVFFCCRRHHWAYPGTAAQIKVRQRRTLASPNMRA